MSQGVLLLDKPAGLSSNAALQKVRRLFRREKAGHTGTLDPLATGLLPICFGQATKYSQTVIDADKSYEAMIRLGYTSTTGDAEGQISRCGDPAAASESEIRTALQRFLGATTQIPPMYSALKKNGRPLYEYARSGESLEREPRNIFINSLQLIDYSNFDVSISVTCSKGTYIRVLAEDIGRALGCGGYLHALRRTKVGGYDIRESTSLGTLEQLPEESRFGLLRPTDSLLESLPAVHLDAEATQRIVNGLPAACASVQLQAGKLRLYGAGGNFLGLGACIDSGNVVPVRMISNPLNTPGTTTPSN
jgi:tRNA pseudouridine55 synthase